MVGSFAQRFLNTFAASSLARYTTGRQRHLGCIEIQNVHFRNPAQRNLPLTWRAAQNSRRKLSFFSNESGNNEFDSAETVANKEEVLNRMLERYPESTSTEDYLVVLRSLATSKLPDAALRAERWLYRLEQRGTPSRECYQRVIEAWSSASKEDPSRVVTRAERWIRKIMNSPDPSVSPDTVCFNAFLDACTKGRGFKGPKNVVRLHAEKASEVLQHMISKRREEGSNCAIAPNTESFNLVIRGWTRCRKDHDIADQTMHILKMLEDFQSIVDEKVGPNARSYGLVMDAIAVKASLKVKQCMTNKKGKLEATSDPSRNGMEEVQILRQILEYLYEKNLSGDQSISPDTFAYNMILSCWANIAPLHSQAPSEAENILQHMKALHEEGRYDTAPDTTSYMLCMRAWVNSKLENRGQRVKWLLDNQWKTFEFSNDIKLRPTVLTYNLVMRAWIDLAKPLEAEMVLTDLLKKSQSEEHESLQPNSESFNILIRAWLTVAEMGSEKALASSVKWLEILVKSEKEETGLQSTPDLYSSILGSARKCAASSSRALELSLNVFNQLRESHHLKECIHYSRMLQIILLSLSQPIHNERRTDLVVSLIRDCQEAGLVGSPLLQALANGPVYPDGWTISESKRLVKELFPHWPLPMGWTRNVNFTDHVPKQSDLRRSMFRLSRHGFDPFAHGTNRDKP
jgi:hypothetical protein